MNAVATRPYRMTTRAAATAQTAEKILDATKHLFAENVIAEITLADIAERSGLTVQTILRRFGDKDAVFAEALMTPAIQPALVFGRRYHRRWCETVFAATLEPLAGADKDRRRAQLIAT